MYLQNESISSAICSWISVIISFSTMNDTSTITLSFQRFANWICIHQNLMQALQDFSIISCNIFSEITRRQISVAKWTASRSIISSLIVYGHNMYIYISARHVHYNLRFGRVPKDARWITLFRKRSQGCLIYFYLCLDRNLARSPSSSQLHSVACHPLSRLIRGRF